MKLTFGKTVAIVSLLLVTILMSGGCVYYNTFYNAKKAFNKAESQRKKRSVGKRSRGGGGYKKAIEKSLKVIEDHPNSKYYDDALFVLGVSYYYSGMFGKAERRFREIIANYPESEYYKESKLYLAKSKLDQEDAEEATALFEEIFREEYDREYKTEAALALGFHYFDAREFDDAERYLLAVRDSLGDGEQKKLAQNYIGDCYFEQFRFSDALSAYLQILGMEPTTGERYHSIFRAAQCSYRLQRIDDGIAYLETLAADELFFDSLGVIQLALAEGYEHDDDLLQAELIYEQIATKGLNKKHVAKAYYYLGLIYQFDYDDLVKAKEYYDKAVESHRGAEDATDALQRSSDIGKLETFARKLEIDSTTTLDMIDEAAATQYRLSELYWFSLDKPDTAMLEMQYLIDSFPESSIVPEAMITLSGMHREYLADSVGADSILYQLLQDFPRSDNLPRVLEALNLTGSEADTGYAEAYIRLAETALVDDSDYVAAGEHYQYVVDNFTESEYYLQARFAVIWLEETYRSPGDSTLIEAYTAFADSFPDSYWAGQAVKRTSYQAPEKLPADRGFEERLAEAAKQKLDDDRPTAAKVDTTDDQTGGYVDQRMTAYIGPNGDTLVLLTERPTEIVEPFEFPTEAYGEIFEDFYLYFQILLDFSGKVTDYDLKIRCNVDEINERASQTVASMTFDPLSVSNKVVQNNLTSDETGGYWFVYKYTIDVPDYLK